MSVVTLRSTRARLLSVVLLGSAASSTLGCSRAEPEPRPSADPAVAASATPSGDRKPATSAPAAAASTPPVAAPAGPLILARGVRIVHAGAGADAAQVVRDERGRAKSDGRDLVVYVGAKWCEPCQAFHKAAAKGELDGEFPDLTLLEFDLDEDRDRLATAGYVSQYIPLFAMPGSDGRASEKKFEGSVKGDGAVANIAPRLRSLLRK
jgi:thiol-disulfide isomerase/thioredoxin